MSLGYETKGGLPDRGATYALLMDNLREAQKHATVLSHLHNTEGSPKDKALALGWLAIAELFRHVQHKVTQLGMGKLSQ